MNKLREYFEHELKVAEIPYKELADENTLNVWFEQFCNAPKKPSLWLYTKQYYTDKEIEEIAKKNNERIPESKKSEDSESAVGAGFFNSTKDYGKLEDLTEQFYRNEEVDEKLYINQIKETIISKTLFGVAEIRELFLDSIYDDSTDRYKEPEETAKVMIGRLEEIPLSFARAIIRSIQNEDINMHIFVKREFGGKELSKHKENKLERMNTILVMRLIDWVQH